MLQTSVLYPQSVFFLQVDGIAGNPADTTHAGWIQALSVSQISPSSFKVTKRFDNWSVKLRECLLTGRHLREAILDYPSGERCTLRQVIILNISGGTPSEELTLQCQSFSRSTWYTAKAAIAPVPPQPGSAYLDPASIIFLQADGIAGNASDTTHTGWIPVLSVNQVSANSFKVTKRVDNWSPKLRECVATGGHLSEAILDYPSGERYALRQVIMTDITGGPTTETLTLNPGSFLLTRYRTSAARTGTARIPG